jgi:2,4-dienoyl-CoA reductase (NADPH2)
MMSRHEPFAFTSKADLFEKAQELGIELPFIDTIDALFKPLSLEGRTVINRLAVQPMEGFDANPDGSPSDLTFRRYRRYAEGGSGLIWFEATSVVAGGRSNPRQLMLKAQNLDSFRQLVESTRQCAYRAFGNRHLIFLVLQLTHSGRYSKPEGKPRPQVAVFNPHLDKDRENVYIVSDEELDRLQETYVEASRLAYRAGFDAVDIKACNGYLLNELLAARTRKNSRYGESFENRIRFIREVVRKIHDEEPGIDLAVRLNAYDGIPYPYSFGVARDGSLRVDLTEPKSLIRRLVKNGCSLFNITIGNPFLNPHFGRPFDRPLPGTFLPEEHPLVGVVRLIKITGELQRETPEIPLVGTGYSWLRHFFPHVGAAVISRGEASLIGLGRSSFAYPDAPKELMNKGSMDPNKACITCSRCTELMHGGHISGCAIRDKDIYGKEYKKLITGVRLS